MLISGKKLAEARERRGMTQAELGEHLGGIIKQNISLWENEKKDIPLKYYDTLKRLFGSSIEDSNSPDETISSSNADGIRSELDRIWPHLTLTERSKILTYAAELLEKSGTGTSEENMVQYRKIAE